MLPIALSAPAWTAIGAMGGALVGATAGGLVDWMLGVRRERALAKAGARLVAGEIAAVDSQLESAQSDAKWWRFYGMPIASWPEYRDVLAMKLSQEEFEVVSQGVMVLEGLREKMPEVPAFRDPDIPFIEIDAADLDGVRGDAAAAYNALAELAGHDQGGDRIHP